MSSCFKNSGLAVALLAVATNVSSPATSNPRHARQLGSDCRDAMGMIKAMGSEIHQMNAQEFFVIAEPELGRSWSHLSHNWDGRPPGHDLEDAWSHRKDGTIFACVRGKSFAGRPLITVADEARIRSAAGLNSPIMFIRIGAPVFNRSRTRALLMFESIGASIGGHTEAYNFEHSRSGWRVVGRQVVSVS